MDNSLKSIWLLVTLLLVFSLSENISAQNQLNLKQFGNEASDFFQQPAKWKAEDWGKLGLVSISAIMIMQTDESIRNETLKDRTYYYSFPIEFGRIWGEPYTTASISALFALSGVINSNNANKKIAFEVIQSLAFSGSITMLSKMILGRARPYNNKGAFTYQHFNFIEDDYWSFPSGHTTAAFSLSTILAKNSKSDLVKAIVYLPALLTAFSRVYQDFHWASDVFLGAAVGYFTAVWIHKQHDIKDELSQNESNQLFVISISF